MSLPDDLEDDLARIEGTVESQRNRTGQNQHLLAATAGVQGLKDQKSADDMQQVRSYMEATVGEPWSSPDMWEALKDGTYLCKFINALAPGSVPKVNRVGMPFKEMENISMFIEGCVKFGLRQGNTFRTPDLYEKRVSYPKAIIDCLLAVKRVAAKGSTKHKAVSQKSHQEKRAEQTALRAKYQSEGGASSDTNFADRDKSKALTAATASVAGVSAEQDVADLRAAKEWIETVTGTPFPPSGDLWEATKNGVLLCKLVNTIRAGAVAKVNKPGAPFKEMENLSHFISACKSLGVRESDTFRPPDLYEKRVSYPKAIINCIHALSKVSKKAKPFAGPYLTVEKIFAVRS